MNTTRTLQALIVEDRPLDAELMVLTLEEAGYRLAWKRVDTEADYLAALETTPDFILSDFALPRFSGLRALALRNQCCPNTPFIIVSGTIGEEQAAEVMRLGACDYLLKDRLGRLAVAVSSAIEQRRLRAETLAAQERYRATFEHAPVGIMHSTADRRILHVNPKLCELLGYTREELLGMTTTDLLPLEYRNSDRPKFLEPMLRGELQTFASERPYVRKDGSIVWVNRIVTLVRDADGRPACFLRIIEDITERKRASVALHESERFARSTIDALPQHLCVLDESGAITAVNEAWRKFATANGISGGCADPGVNYLAVCDAADGDNAAEGPQFAAGIRAVLSGELEEFALEYPCHSPGEQRWFVGRVTKFQSAGPKRVVITHEDITSRKLFELEVQAGERRFHAIFDYAGVGISMRPAHDRTLPWIQVNDRFCNMLGYTREELLKLSTAAITHPDEHGDAIADNRHLLRGEVTNYTREKRIARKDGSYIWVILTVSLLPDSDGKPEYIMATYQNITERKRIEAALMESDEKFRQLSDNIPQVFWITDADQQSVIYVSPAYETVTGRRLADLEGNPRDWLEAVYSEDRERVRHARRHKAPAGEYDIEYRIVHSDGTVRWVHDRAFPIKDATGAVCRIAGITDDITERRNAEERLLQLAHYDALTSLPNRVLFRDRLAQALAQAGRNSWVAGVMFIDLDRFKLVNDSLGHTVGDTLLQQVSVRLSECLRVGDTVGRLGGDEFSVILPRLAAAQDASLVAQKILDALAEPFMIDGNEIFVSASIGITLYPSDSVDIDTLIRNADAAMFSAKEAGRGTYQYFTQEMNDRALERMRTENRLRRALERNEFVLHYQPKVTIADDRISGVEALLRWQVPENGLVSPDSFIPVLEETGLIVPVGEWVVRSACAQIADWRAAGVKPVPIAINISARQLQQPGFSAMVADMLVEHEVEPKWLEIEITESSIMFHPDEASTALGNLKTLGIRISVDDFGTGYSSLARLKRFPLDALKIDRSFVRDIANDLDDAAITRSVITLAHSLDLGVVAEGVETPEQLAYLLENGCDEAQGYLFSRPLPAAECTALLQDRRKPPSDGDGTQHLLRYAPHARRGRVPNRTLKEAAAAADAERGQRSNLPYI